MSETTDSRDIMWDVRQRTWAKSARKACACVVGTAQIRRPQFAGRHVTQCTCGASWGGVCCVPFRRPRVSAPAPKTAPEDVRLLCSKTPAHPSPMPTMSVGRNPQPRDKPAAGGAPNRRSQAAGCPSPCLAPAAWVMLSAKLSAVHPSISICPSSCCNRPSGMAASGRV